MADIHEMTATVPMSRLIAVATEFGSQDTYFCPPKETLVCFRHRGLVPYLPESARQPREYECTECWLRFILMGD